MVSNALILKSLLDLALEDRRLIAGGNSKEQNASCIACPTLNATAGESDLITVLGLDDVDNATSLVRFTSETSARHNEPMIYYQTLTGRRINNLRERYVLPMKLYNILWSLALVLLSFLGFSEELGKS